MYKINTIIIIHNKIKLQFWSCNELLDVQLYVHFLKHMFRIYQLRYIIRRDYGFTGNFFLVNLLVNITSIIDVNFTLTIILITFFLKTFLFIHFY